MDLALQAQDSLNYLVVLMSTVVALVITCVILFLNKLLGQKPKENTRIKGDTYECGVPYEGDARQQFSVRYYLVGIIFLIFDVEVVFVYPWAMVFKHSASEWTILAVQMLLFALPLVVAYLYLRLCGAFDWD